MVLTFIALSESGRCDMMCCGKLHDMCDFFKLSIKLKEVKILVGGVNRFEKTLVKFHHLLQIMVK